jgi:flagellar export protein FliJ
VAISNSLRRLLHIRKLEEEQRKIALESVLAELHNLKVTLGAMRARERGGRERVALSSQSSDPADRIASLVECESARRSAQALEGRIAETASRASAARDDYVSKRVERRQVETVLEEAEEARAAERARREQEGVDQWFSARRHTRSAPRRNEEKLEIRDSKETGSVPEEELRSNS